MKNLCYAFALSVVTMAALTGTARASQLGPATCGAVSVYEPDGFPPDLPAFLVSTEGASTVTAAHLESPAGALLPTLSLGSDTVTGGGEVLIKLNGSLSPSTPYTLVLSAACPDGVQHLPQFLPEVRQMIDTGSRTALPTQIGTITQLPGFDRGQLTITIDPTPEMRAYLFDISFNWSYGAWSLWGPYGQLVDEQAVAGSTAPNAPLTFTFYADLALGLSADGLSGGSTNVTQLCEGMDSLTRPFVFRAHVAGAASDPAPITKDIVFDCNAWRTTPEGMLPVPNEDGAAAGTDPHSGLGGCSVAKHGEAGSGLWLSPFAAVSLGLAMRRRRRVVRSGAPGR